MINIREALESDIKAVHELGESVPEFLVNTATVNFWPLPVLQNAVASDDVIILLAEEEDQLAGFTIVNCNLGLQKALIENVYVKPQSRGDGVARKLLSTLVELLQSKGYGYIAALVLPDASNTISLYENSGFLRGQTFLWLDTTLAESFKSESAHSTPTESRI